MDLDDIVAAAVDKATEGEGLPEPEVSPDETETSGDETVPEAESESETPEVKAETPEVEPVKVVEPVIDELTKELEEAGIKAPKKGENNKIPYSRVRKIVENALKKRVSAHGEEVSSYKSKLDDADKRLANMDAVDKLIAGDPDRYIGMLASIHPEKYKKFLQPTTQTVEPAKTTPTEKIPGPDLKYQDGSVGYSEEQLQKRDEWLMSQAEQRATDRVTKQFEERFGPVEKDWRSRRLAAQHLDELRPRIKAQLDEARKTWGKYFEDEEKKGTESDVFKEQQKNPGMPFEAVVTRVLLPRIMKDQNATREQVLKEINEKPKAASKSPAVSAKAAVSDEPRSMEDVVREAIAKAGLK